MCYLDGSSAASTTQLTEKPAPWPPAAFFMTESPLTNADDSAGSATPARPADQNIFRSPALPFGFLRVCLYVLLGDGIAYGLRWLARFFLDGGRDPYAPRRLMTGEIVALVGAFSAAWMMSRLEKRTFGSYGLPLASARAKFFWPGLLFGLTEISVVVGAAGALGSYHFGVVLIHGRALLHWAVFWAVFFLVVSLYEEFAFRGYVQFTLAQGIGFWPAAILLSIMFGAQHLGNPGETWAGIAGIVLAGLFWCFTLRRTGSLWFAIGMHASFDFGETFLYSVPDSGMIFPGHLSNATFAGPAWLTGGTAGPEASVFDFLVLCILFYAIHRLYPTNPATKPEA
jgi:membrane protease YdiL (CAAX protease family)